MISTTYIVKAHGVNPYENLALESRLMESVLPGQCILYLWQNAHTVVVGRNQNAWQECHVAKLQQDGGHLARRLSGGGAVYHDMGNLNFTFILAKEDYSIPRQAEVILRGVEAFGLRAERSGRNDILIDGRKFSGNAFYQSGGKAYHHGTLLVDVDRDCLPRYLNVDAEKYRSKGVASVKSRVVNLHDLCGDITVPALTEALITAFGEVYEHPPQAMEIPKDDPRLRELFSQYASWEWRLGQSIPFTWEGSRRYAWGNIQLRFQVEKGHIAACQVFSDAMEESIIRDIPDMLSGCTLQGEALRGALVPLSKINHQMFADITGFLQEQTF